MKEMIKKLQKRSNKKGFTLVEIIVVLVILAILAAIAVPAVLGYVNDAKESKYISEARAIYIVVQTEEAKFRAENGLDSKVPVTLDTTNGVTKDTNGKATAATMDKSALATKIANKTDFKDVSVSTVAADAIASKEAHYKFDWTSDKPVHAEVYSNKEVKITDN